MPPGPRPDQPEGTAVLVVNGNFADSSWANIFHIRSLTATMVGEADWEAFVDDFIGALVLAGFYEEQSADLNVTEVRGLWRDHTGYYLETLRPASITGGDGGDTLSAGAAAVVSWQGRWRYRGGKPKTFMAGLPADSLATTKVLNPIFQANLQAAASDLIGQVNALVLNGATDVEFGTLSYQSGGAWRTPPIFRKYLGAVVHSRIASQRRRDGDWLA